MIDLARITNHYYGSSGLALGLCIAALLLLLIGFATKQRREPNGTPTGEPDTDPSKHAEPPSRIPPAP